MVECTILNEPVEQDEVEPTVQTPSAMENSINTYEMYVDGSSISGGLEVGLVLVGLEGVVAEYALLFKFLMTNNEIEYEVLITRLGVARELEVQDLKAYSDS